MTQHVWLVCTNVTTYEVAKWRHLKALVHALQQRWVGQVIVCVCVCVSKVQLCICLLLVLA